MKQFIYILMVLFFPVSSIWSQTSVPNYIITTIPTSPVTDPTALVDNGSSQNSNSTIQYFDGLGRPTETVQKGITPTGKDLVALTEYDGVGREYLHWLPVANAGSGAYVDAATFKTNAGSFYSTVANDSYPYTTTEYEASPLNRVTGQYGAGAAWNNPTSPKKVKTEYGTNAASEVAYFHVDGSSQLVRGADGYAASTLYKTTVTDEDGKTTAEYKDKQGRVVMVRRGADVDTYWVYNDLGQLAYVLPPLAADNMTATTPFADTDPYLKKYGYLYKYDERGNCIEKRVPGCEPVYMVYDKAGRLVLSQDGNQRAKTPKRWTVTKYDALGRVIYTGVTSTLSGSSHAGLVSAYKDDLVVEAFVDGRYTVTKFPGASVLTENYYDNYGFLSPMPSGQQQALGYQAKDGYGKAYPESAIGAAGLNAKGLLTGTRTWRLDGSLYFSTTALYYDDRGRVVQERWSNTLFGTNSVYNLYNFAGQVKQSLTEHTRLSSAVLAELYTYDYDQAGRLLKTRYKVNSNPEVVLSDMTAAGSYDELGRLAARKRHGGADTESFAYNIRSWPTRITSGTFEENLYYAGNPAGAAPCYNGNISYGTWTYNGVAKGYAYAYDGLNRLLNANFKKGTSAQADGAFDELFTYDKMGNIQTLQRKKDGTAIDDLSLYYGGNQLTCVNDARGSQNSYTVKEYQNKSAATSGEFAYDANGNMVKDLDRGIVTIRYNVLNLPDTIQFGNGNQIVNCYMADGTKMGTDYYTRKTALATPIVEGTVCNYLYAPYLVDQTGTLYMGNKEYATTAGQVAAGAFPRVYNPEGYTTNGTAFNYYRRDHLGNNREVWYANSNVVAQRTQYYPSGLPWAEGLRPSTQTRKYNGKEWVEMHGLDEYDSQARWYYPVIVRTPTVDPLAEKYYSISPYAWCGGNPVNRIDPDGMQDVATLPYDLYKAYRLYRAYRAAQVTAAAGGAFVLGKFGVDYYNNQKMKQRAHEVSNSLIQRANLSKEYTQEAKVSTPEQRREQKRREEKSRQEDANTTKAHNEMVNNNVGTPSSDGTPEPKNTPDNVTIGTVIAVGVGTVAAYEDSDPSNQLEPIPTPELPKPEPPKIEPLKIDPVQPNP